MKCTRYFLATRQRPDRREIRIEWILRTVRDPARSVRQTDGRWRHWPAITEADGRWLRVVLLEDRETVHHAFYDRDYLP